MKNMKRDLPIKIQTKLVNCVKKVGDNKQQKDFYMLLNEIAIPEKLLQQRIQG